MDFGMPTLIEIETLEGNLALCRDLGLQFVELNMNLPYCAIHQLEQVEALRGLISKYGVYLTIHMEEPMDVCSFNPIIANAWLETTARTLRVAAALGSPIVNIHMNHGIHFTLPGRKEGLYNKYRDQYMESTARFKEVCRQETVGQALLVSIENTTGFPAYEQDAIDFMLESPAFGLTLDIGHAHETQYRDLGFINHRLNRLRHLHLHDAGPLGCHLPLGTGEVDLAKAISLGRERGCRSVVETKTVEAMRQSATWLKQHNYL